MTASVGFSGSTTTWSDLSVVTTAAELAQLAWEQKELRPNEYVSVIINKVVVLPWEGDMLLTILMPAKVNSQSFQRGGLGVILPWMDVKAT